MAFCGGVVAVDDGGRFDRRGVVWCFVARDVDGESNFYAHTVTGFLWCGAWGRGSWLVAVAPPPGVLVALFRMVGRLGMRVGFVVPMGRRWFLLLARCAWLALAVAVLVVVCRLLALS